MEKSDVIHLNRLKPGSYSAIIRNVDVRDAEYEGHPCQLIRIRLEIDGEVIHNYIPIEEKFEKKIAYFGYALGFDGEFTIDDLCSVSDVMVTVKLVEHYSIPGRMVVVQWNRMVV